MMTILTFVSEGAEEKKSCHLLKTVQLEVAE
jgi:hypothetical protein